MKNNTHSHGSILPIAIAEGGSTAISLGALWVMERSEGLLAPLQNLLVRNVIYPDLAQQKPPHSPQDEHILEQRAHQRASVLVKGAGMLAAGFASHIPLQLALEKKLDAKAFRTAAMGKGIGVATSLGGIIMLSNMAPEFLPKIQSTLAPIISPFIPKDKRDGDGPNDEIAKLLILDVASSVIAGLVNYAISHKLR